MDLLDEIMPEWHYGNRHQIVVDAPADRVIEAVESLELERAPVLHPHEVRHLARRPEPSGDPEHHLASGSLREH